MNNKIIATYCLSNSSVIAIYDIIHDINDYVIAGFNNDKPRKYKIYYTGKDSYFNFGKLRIKLSECLKVNI